MQDLIHELENARVFHLQNINVLTFRMHTAVRDFKKAAIADDSIEMAHIEHDVMAPVLENLKSEKAKLAEVEGDIAELEVRKIIQRVAEEMDAPELAVAQALYTPRSI